MFKKRAFITFNVFFAFLHLSAMEEDAVSRELIIVNKSAWDVEVTLRQDSPLRKILNRHISEKFAKELLALNTPGYRYQSFTDYIKLNATGLPKITFKGTRCKFSQVEHEFDSEKLANCKGEYAILTISDQNGADSLRSQLGATFKPKIEYRQEETMPDDVVAIQLRKDKKFSESPDSIPFFIHGALLWAYDNTGFFTKSPRDASDSYILGVPENATDEEKQFAYNQLILQRDFVQVAAESEDSTDDEEDVIKNYLKNRFSQLSRQSE